MKSSALVGVTDSGARTSKTKSLDILLCLCAVIAMSAFYYGLRVLLLCGIALVCSLATELILLRFYGQKHWKSGDFSFLITPLIITLLLPATVPIWILVTAIIFAAAVVKFPFGGAGNNIFNPAAAAVGFVAVCWPDLVTKYPPVTQITAENLSTLTLSSSYIGTLRNQGIPSIGLLNMLLGRYSGPMGATCAFVLLACLLYLLFRRTASFTIVSAAVLSMSAMFLLMNHGAYQLLYTYLFHALCSSFLFGITFMASDPTTSPVGIGGKLLYGLLLGTLTMVFLYFGSSELIFVFPLLLVNALSQAFNEEKLTVHSLHKGVCDGLAHLKSAFSKPAPPPTEKEADLKETE